MLVRGLYVSSGTKTSKLLLCPPDGSLILTLGNCQLVLQPLRQDKGKDREPNSKGSRSAKTVPLKRFLRVPIWAPVQALAGVGSGALPRWEAGNAGAETVTLVASTPGF